MNNARRKRLTEIAARVSALTDMFAPLASDLRSIADDIEDVKSEESEAYDGLPESLQGGERGDQMQAAISELESAMDTITDLADALGDFCTDSIVSQLDTAAE